MAHTHYSYEQFVNRINCNLFMEMDKEIKLITHLLKILAFIQILYLISEGLSIGAVTCL